MALIHLLQSSPPAYIVLVFVAGLLVGSFLNVVIHRLPKMMEHEWRRDCTTLLHPEQALAEEPQFNLLVPRSRCPSCKELIRARDNIPVISYLMLRGRCRNCTASINPRYPVIELLTAALSALVAWRFGCAWQGIAALFFTWTLIALAVIDLDTQLLPDSITLPFLWLGIAVNYVDLFVPLRASILGAMCGYLALWLVYWGFKLITGKEGMGYGDFKLLAMICAWLGLDVLPLVIIAASVVGAIVGISLIVWARHDRRQPIPFGPYLTCAGWFAMMWGERLQGLFRGLGTGL